MKKNNILNHFQHVLYSVLSIHGEILRIVIYNKFQQLKAFVEYPFSLLILYYLYLYYLYLILNCLKLNHFNYTYFNLFS